MTNAEDVLMDVYGDESAAGTAVVYGAVPVPTRRVELAEHFLELLKTSVGDDPTTNRFAPGAPGIG